MHSAPHSSSAISLHRIIIDGTVQICVLCIAHDYNIYKWPPHRMCALLCTVWTYIFAQGTNDHNRWNAIFTRQPQFHGTIFRESRKERKKKLEGTKINKIIDTYKLLWKFYNQYYGVKMNAIRSAMACTLSLSLP